MHHSPEQSSSFKREALSEQVRRSLKEEILGGVLQPGQKVDVSYYSATWDTSSTPIRDALRKLESDGLIEIHARKGAFVATIDKRNIQEVFELRIAIECMAIQLAATHMPTQIAEDALAKYKEAALTADAPSYSWKLLEIDELIHNLAAKYCGNTRLQKAWESTQDLVRWSRLTIIRNLREPYAATLPEHIAICEAVVARDPRAANKAMRTHLENTLQRVSESFNEDAVTS